jgi:hypothetical protein
MSHVRFFPIIETEDDTWVDIYLTGANPDLPGNKWLAKFLHVETHHVSDGEHDETAETLVVCETQKRRIKHYKNLTDLKETVDGGFGGFVFLPPFSADSHIGHFLMWLRVGGEVIFVDPCRDIENRFDPFGDDYYVNRLELQTEPLFAFSVTSSDTQVDNYFDGEVEVKEEPATST